ncbi:MAG TPA: hypothetical protein VML19_08315 [Verrucomicrobiae bacterium]|nr:hypothetical protein [Verrucomicrobiae bacterium]
MTEGVRRSEALTADIQEAILTMQFQDRLSQRIMHIVEATRSMQAELERHLDPLGRSPESARSKAAELLADSYTMHGERMVHATALGESHAAEEVLDDVEIF